MKPGIWRRIDLEDPLKFHNYHEFSSDLSALGQLLQTYVANAQSGEGKTITQEPMPSVAEALKLEQHIRHGGLKGEARHAFMEQYLDYTTRLHHPGYMAHQVAVTSPGTALGATISAVTNNGMNIYEMGPPASTIEFTIVNWLLGKIGWKEMPWPADMPAAAGAHGAGLLTHGGSLANLTALLGARAHAFPKFWSEGMGDVKPVILASATNHYSISRAAGIMGMGTRSVHHLPTLEFGVLDPDKVAAVYRQSVADGGTPFMLVANACATASGLYDPLTELAEVCKELDLWFHVDGAHGSAALAAPKLRHLLRGVELADSFICDLHKMFATNALCAAVLMKRAPDLFGTFQQDASYLFHEKDEPGFDFMPHTVECTKTAMGLRFFLVLAEMGEEGMADFITDLHEESTKIAATIRDTPGFSIPHMPESNIICFRYGDDCEQQVKLRTALTRDGRYHISTTLLEGKRYMRVVIMNPATRVSDIKDMLRRIETFAGET